MNDDSSKIIDCISSKSWRMNHLYRIVDKKGISIPFKLNPVQTEVLKNLHNRNIILKARKLGMSTFSVLYLMDEALFTPTLGAGIVSYSLDHSRHIFKTIIGHAIDTILPKAKNFFSIKTRSTSEITFSNGSFLRVGSTLRGGTYKIILVSEFGKTCARNPLKAEEVITGTLQAVPKDGKIIIESTGEGNSGFYAEMVTAAAQRGNKKLSSLQYKLFFFPWYRDADYILKRKIDFPVEITDYFAEVEKKQNVKLSKDQRSWYSLQKDLLGDKLKQEYPSTISEAFLSSSDAFYFQRGIEKSYTENRCLSINPYDPLEPVYAAMDIGVNDLTVICFFQVVHGEIRIIDYYSENNKGVDHYAFYMQKEKRYLYHTIFLPHDAKKRDGLIVENTYEREFIRLFRHSDTKITVLSQTDKGINISNAKQKLDRCVFNTPRVKPFIDMLNKYRKKWSEMYGKYIDEPYHDDSSNYADAFMYACQSVSHIETVVGNRGDLEKHRKAVASRRKLF